jgi:hypothetical protein
LRLVWQGENKRKMKSEERKKQDFALLAFFPCIFPFSKIL